MARLADGGDADERRRIRAESRRLREQARRLRAAAQATRRKLQKIPPEDEAARDEGPRLIPLPGGARREKEPFGRAVELGDIALGNPKKRRRWPRD